MNDAIWEDLEETFASFGRAAFGACLLEMVLAHALLLLVFMRRVGREMVDDEGRISDAKKYRHELRKFVQLQRGKTLGNLLRDIRHLKELDSALKKRIAKAVQHRNFLMHHFWRQSTQAFATPQGRAKMIDELVSYDNEFSKLGDDINLVLDTIFDRLGLDSEKVNRDVEKFLRDAGLSLLE